jgi:hypothetical protein
MRVVGETLHNSIYIRQRGDFEGERDVASTHCTLADMEVVEHEEGSQVS